MRNIIIVLVAVILSVIFVTILRPVQGVQTGKSVLQQALDRGVLRCGYAVWEPMLMADPNTKKLSGISYDIMEEIGKKLGIKIEWTEETSWGEYPQALKNNRFDAFCVAGYPNSQRVRMVQFTKPILYSPFNLYVRADDFRFDNNPVQVNQPLIRLSYIDGTTQELTTKETFTNAAHDPLPQLTPFSNIFMEVVAKKADATLMDSATAGYYMKANPDKIKVAIAGMHVFPNVFAVKMGEYDLQQALDTILDELSAAGVIDRVIQNYEPLPGTYYHMQPGYRQ